MIEDEGCWSRYLIGTVRYNLAVGRCVLEKGNRERSIREVRNVWLDITPAHDLFNPPAPARTNKQASRPERWRSFYLDGKNRFQKTLWCCLDSQLGYISCEDCDEVMITPKHPHAISRFFNKTTCAEDQKAWSRWIQGSIILWMKMMVMMMKTEFKGLD